MYFEEDPFDRWCRLLVAFMVKWVHVTELAVWVLVQYLEIQGSYAWLQLTNIMWRVGILIYYRFISPLLVECGLKKVPTFAEVESRRLQLIAKFGYDIPRPADLEERLREEQMASQKFDME